MLNFKQGAGMCFRCFQPTKTHLLHCDIARATYLLSVETVAQAVTPIFFSAQQADLQTIQFMRTYRHSVFQVKVYCSKGLESNAAESR